MADKIIISGLECYTHIGAQARERRYKQKCVIDLELQRDLSPAGRSDRLGETVDYSKVIQVVLDLVNEQSYKLLERLATEIAERLLVRFSVEQVTVRVKKLNPTSRAFLDWTAVELTRSALD
ncbi:MAG: dihydroneopterin aldolase [Acidobacteria bacterium]|nr:dihydroneopterin aldolase [Acidobacteriota bacterium]